MWTIKVQGVGELLLSLRTDGTLAYAQRGNGLWDTSWGPPQEAEAIGRERPDGTFREAKFQELRKRRRSHRSDKDYQEVAEIYRRAQADGAPVQRTVADALHVGTAHAARLIGEARRRGFLPPTTKGKAKA